MNQQLFEQVDNYISNFLAPQDEALINVTDNLKLNRIDNASISPNQGKFLQVLAIICNARRILEIGTLGGYSTIWLARTIPPGGKVISIECDEKHAAVAQENILNARLNHVVEIKTGKALEILPKLLSEAPFDMIFIDADKPPYLEYFQWAIRLARPGTVIVADNVIRNGKVLDPDSTDEKVKGVQRLNQMLAGCKEVSSTILQTVGVKEYDGMVVAVVNRQL